MSLIERALGRAKDAAKVTTSAAVKRPALQLPEARAMLSPDLRVTVDMRERLGLNAGHELQHQHASEYRHIKRQVVAEIRANPAERIVLVASALAGDGKSFTAANLAISLALEPDFTVLLVDADAINPQLSRTFGLASRPGLMNALVDPGCDSESLIVTTDIDGLSVLPAGSANDNATEYFGSDHMRQVLARLLAVPNRIVLIDSLPLLLTTEVRALVPLVSQVLLVVRAESTPATAVQQALSLIGENTNVKLVLNAVSRTHLARYLGYDYGFDYNYSPKR
jgi:protein-tyrosine kinase